MKKRTFFLMLFALIVGLSSCEDKEEIAPLPTEFEEDVEDTPGGDIPVNLIHDADFETADLERKLTDSPIIYNEWVVLNNYPSTISFSTAYDGEQETVGKMMNTTTSIPNADPTRAFIAQRIKGVVEPALYTFYFKGKSSGGTPTCRIFIKATDAAGNVVERYFIYDTEKPTSPTGKYWAYCKNCLLSSEWVEFSYVIDFSKITDQKASITYESALNASLVDRTDIVLCLQNNAQNSTMLIDDVTLIKYINEE